MGHLVTWNYIVGCKFWCAWVPLKVGGSYGGEGNHGGRFLSHQTVGLGYAPLLAKWNRGVGNVSYASGLLALAVLCSREAWDGGWVGKGVLVCFWYVGYVEQRNGAVVEAMKPGFRVLVFWVSYNGDHVEWNNRKLWRASDGRAMGFEIPKRSSADCSTWLLRVVCLAHCMVPSIRSMLYLIMWFCFVA